MIGFLKHWKDTRCENCGHKIRVPVDMFGRLTTRDCGCLDTPRKDTDGHKADA